MGRARESGGAGWVYRLGANPEWGGRHPTAPFGLGPRVGARVAPQHCPTLRPGQCYCSRRCVTEKQDKGDRKKLDSARLSDLGCLRAAQDPSRLGQLESLRGCVSLRHRWLRPEHVALYGVARRGGIRIRQVKQPPVGRQAEPPARAAGGGKRRNVLGAAAREKNDCNSPKRSNDNPDEPRRTKTTTTAHACRPITKVAFASRSRFALTHRILFFLLTTSFRNGV